MSIPSTIRCAPTRAIQALLRKMNLNPEGQRILATGDIFGGKPIRTSDIPESIKQGVDAFDPQSLALHDYISSGTTPHGPAPIQELKPI